MQKLDLSSLSDQLRAVVEQIISLFNPEKIILFGSRARGTNRPDSDVDLLIIDNKTKDRMERTYEYLSNIDYDDLDIGVDFVIINENQFNKGNSDPCNIYAKNILKDGKVLYEK